jgi:hypothetical protein
LWSFALRWLKKKLLLKPPQLLRLRLLLLKVLPLLLPLALLLLPPLLLLLPPLPLRRNNF